MKKLILILFLLFSTSSFAGYNFNASYKVGTVQTKVTCDVVVTGHSQSLESVNLKGLTDKYKFRSGCGDACGGSIDDLKDYTVIGDYSKSSITSTDIKQNIGIDAQASGTYCDVSIDAAGMTMGFKNSNMSGYEQSTIVDTSETNTETQTSFKGQIFDGHVKVGDISNVDISAVKSVRNTTTVTKQTYTEFTLESYVD